jgi:hypothetical protein
LAVIGSDIEAIQLVMRTNKRRNLNSGQWATIAVEAEDIMGAIAEQVEKEADAKRSEATKAQRAGDDKKLSSPQKTEHTNTTPTKAAEIFQTNRTYINQATKIKKASPEVAGWSTPLASLQKLHLWHPQRILSASSHAIGGQGKASRPMETDDWQPKAGISRPIQQKVYLSENPMWANSRRGAEKAGLSFAASGIAKRATSAAAASSASIRASTN